MVTKQLSVSSNSIKGSLIKVIMVWGCFFGTSTAFGQIDIYKYIENEAVISENKEATHATFYSFANEEKALINNYKNAQNYLSLNGLWKFKWVRKPSDRPIDFFNPTFNTKNWDDIKVPANWEVEGFGVPIYVNHQYEFADFKAPVSPEIEFIDGIYPKNPGKVPHDYNPVGSYRRSFTLGKEWQNKEVFLHIGAMKSGGFVWINGHYVGYSQGSKLPAEFDISQYLQEGENTLAIQIFRWTDGSYLECQDFWRISGIERDVYLYAQPKTRIKDIDTKTFLDKTYENGVLDLDIEVQNHHAKSKKIAIQYKLLDSDSKVVSSETKSFKIGANELQKINFSDVVQQARIWSAEQPNLYKLIINLKERNKVLESTSVNVGFRTVEIKNGLLYVNNKRITLKGVNTQEHNPETGHVISKEQIINDIRLWKAHNINAVRLSHYPQPEMFYDLCDQYGIYVVDEANIESHGMYYGKHSLAKKKSWVNAHVDRMVRMVERDKNHPSVIIWSMGNEAGNGTNFMEGYAQIKALDKSKRPVQYERTYNEKERGGRIFDMTSNTDIIVPQYPSPDDFLMVGEHKTDRPYIPSEYAHSMGNSTGNFQDYWDIIEKYDNLQGGFIWDWVDQSIFKTDDKGNKYYVYGGDFGKNMPSDNTFLNNGIVFPNRTPQPALYEVKKAYEYINFKPKGVSGDKKLLLFIENLYDFTNLNKFDFRVLVKANGKTIHSANLPDIKVSPNTGKLIRIPIDKVTIEENTEYLAEIQAVLKKGDDLLKKGHIVAHEQIALSQLEKWTNRTLNPDIIDSFSLTEDQNSYSVSNDQFSIKFDKTKGIITSYSFQGNKLLKEGKGPKPNFWRAPTDNDFGSRMHIRNIGWKEASLYHKVVSFEAKQAGQNIDVQIVFELPGVETTFSSHYTIYPSGVLKIANQLDASNYKADIPRVGMQLQLPKSMEDLTYYGRGPWENYIDRKASAFIGLYSSKVKDQHVPYVRPQENGYKTETRWLALKDSNQNGLMFVSSKDNPDQISFSAMPMLNEDFDATGGVIYDESQQKDLVKKYGKPSDINLTKHTTDIMERNLVQLNIDLAQRGVAGDDSWGSLPQKKYRLESNKQYNYTFYMVPFIKGHESYFIEQFKIYHNQPGH